MKKLLLTLELIGGAIWWCKTKCSSGDTISLENIRRGIAEGWYTVKICSAPNQSGVVEYYAILTGKNTDGGAEETVQTITASIYEALKADGVPEV